MITIKDKIQIMRNQVEIVQEMPEQPVEEKKEAPKTQYDAIDDDAIDLLVKKHLAEIETTVGIQRIQEAVYQIGDKTLSLRINADNDQVLEVRVGSSWIKFDDYLKTLKNREEVQIQAELGESKDAQPTGAAPAKKKKKKKAKKKVDLDLDMDEDDPTQQTRFAAHVK